jgi:membrane protease YdiL (CAAX protease family)
MTGAFRFPRLRFGLLLWAAGFVGVVSITVTLLPRMFETVTPPAPLWVISLASFAQSGLLLALAVWAGVALAPAVRLRAPAFEAAVTGDAIAPALKSQLLPGLVSGVVGGMLLLGVRRSAPAALAEMQERLAPPLAARVLYGGLTEELLLRWGVMTALAWLAWRFLQRRQGPIRRGFVWLAIAVSAILFGVGHLPVASAMLGGVDASVAAFVIGWNTAFGLLFGYLFWRYGLESAMIAHGLAHVVSYLIDGGPR